MDTGPYTHEEYKDCLQKLFLVGKYSGIHLDTLRILQQVEPKSILDIGCGDGAMLASLAKHFPQARCHGIDISQEAISHANPAHNLTFSCTTTLEDADVVMATLVLHHIDDKELKDFLQNAYFHAKKLVVINDLQRSLLSKALFRLISKPLFANRLISHDGIISIEKGFIKEELKALIEPLEAAKYTIRWRFPFRWQVLIWK